MLLLRDPVRFRFKPHVRIINCGRPKLVLVKPSEYFYACEKTRFRICVDDNTHRCSHWIRRDDLVRCIHARLRGVFQLPAYGSGWRHWSLLQRKVNAGLSPAISTAADLSVSWQSCRIRWSSINYPVLPGSRWVWRTYHYRHHPPPPDPASSSERQRSDR